jgi:hypothetical protein
MPNNEGNNRRGMDDQQQQRQNRQQQDQQRSPGSGQSESGGKQAGTGIPEGEKIGEWSDESSKKSGKSGQSDLDE